MNGARDLKSELFTNLFYALSGSSSGHEGFTLPAEMDPDLKVPEAELVKVAEKELSETDRLLEANKRQLAGLESQMRALQREEAKKAAKLAQVRAIETAKIEARREAKKAKKKK